MESKGSKQAYEEFPMNSGDGEYSYAKNSSGQREGLDMANQILKEAIDHFDIGTLPFHSSHALNIVDLGCSVGPNTFFAVQNIIESINLKLQSNGYDFDRLEFNVFFNDHVGNDFNTLFKSLPIEKPYYAAGVPGSFHGRLFPKSSLHFVHSSYALQWLSRVPKEILDKHSPAFNKGKIYFTTAAKEVAQVYSAQFAKDMEGFLNSRALELVPGGLMALLIPCITLNCKNKMTASIDIFGDTLLDMASKGIVSDDLVNFFNLPLYFPTPEELKLLIETNGNYSIEKMEPIVRPRTEVNVNAVVLHCRAGWEGIVREHFGGDIVDQIFEQFKSKLDLLVKRNYVESIYVPLYFPASKEFEALIKKNGNFSIQRMGILSKHMSYISPSVEMVVGTMRAAIEALFKEQFGEEATDEFFERYTMKLPENFYLLDSKFREHEDLFVILKHRNK